jgi:hypothetical protein
MIFPQFEQLKNENKLFIGPKLRKNLFWTNKKFLFQMLKLRKNRRKNWGKQDWLFGGLMS